MSSVEGTEQMMAPRAADVFCTQCDKHYAVEPDRCSCGCIGFRLRLPSDDVATPAPIEPPAWEWAVVEIMGHRKHAGRCREEERFGAKMLRVDIPIDGDATKGWQTRYYGGPSIFSYQLTDEASVMAANKPYEPPSRYSLEHVRDRAEITSDDEPY